MLISPGVEQSRNDGFEASRFFQTLLRGSGSPDTRGVHTTAGCVREESAGFYGESRAMSRVYVHVDVDVDADGMSRLRSPVLGVVHEAMRRLATALLGVVRV